MPIARPSRIAAPELEGEADRFFRTLYEASESGAKETEVEYGGARFTLALPPLGEGDRGIVYDVRAHDLPIPSVPDRLCLKVAKQHPVCRERLLQEQMTTSFFLAEGVRVPRIHFMDADGRFALKDLVEGESITRLYLRYTQLSPRMQGLVLQGLEAFLARLLGLFQQRHDCQVSIGPNNIYVVGEDGELRDPPEFVLVDPGRTLKKNYDGLTFARYWKEFLPEHIRKYERTGYLRWLVPQELTESESEQAKEFEIFQGLKPSEISALLEAARTIEFDAQEVILREGEVGENLYLVLEGEVEARRGIFRQPVAPWARMGRGSVLGELEFLVHVRRPTSVVAATPAKLIEIDQERFQQLLEADLVVPYKLIQRIAVMLADRLHGLAYTPQPLV